MGRFHKLSYALRQTICALRLTFEKLFTDAKVWRKVQKIGVGCKTVYEIDPRNQIYKEVFLYLFYDPKLADVAGK